MSGCKPSPQIAKLQLRSQQGTSLPGQNFSWRESRSLKACAGLLQMRLMPVSGRGWQPTALRGDSLAYLQYTSGSTTSPRGVMVSHGNVLHNCAYINEGFRHTAESISLSWLPHFHDMGLVQGIIEPIYIGMLGLLMSPASFLQRPFDWLQAVTRHRVTHSGGPDFAYDLCVRKISPDQRRSLDLKSWIVAYNGAEPIRKATLESFAEAFKACGFKRKAFYPAYGLAEATLKVSGGLVKRRAYLSRFQI